MITLKEYKQSKDIKGLVQKMFEARQVSHNLHLKTKSYSEHKALGSFYEFIIDKIDEFIETYQGQYGIIEDCEITINKVENSLEYLENCAKLFIVGRDSIKESHLKNIMDEIITFTYRTIYKIKNLK